VGCFSCGSAPRPRCSHARSIFLFITFLAIFPIRGRQTSRIRRPSTLTTTTTRCAPLLTLHSSAQAWVTLPCPALALSRRASPRLRCFSLFSSIYRTCGCSASTNSRAPSPDRTPSSRQGYRPQAFRTCTFSLLSTPGRCPPLPFLIITPRYVQYASLCAHPFVSPFLSLVSVVASHLPLFLGRSPF
jgi:hypothetical protein